MRCERCGITTVGYDLFDYCARCGKNLCDGCMAKGCCWFTPARSGMEDDVAEREPPSDERGRKTLVKLRLTGIDGEPTHTEQSNASADLTEMRRPNNGKREP